jgi:hypothetical protein
VDHVRAVAERVLRHRGNDFGDEQELRIISKAFERLRRKAEVVMS